MTTGREIELRAELTPGEVVEGATIQAKLLMNIVEQTHCYQEIAKKKYLQVEAWETIGAFNRTHAETESISQITRDNDVIGYQARVQLWKDGKVVGGAVMPCYFTENCCRGKDGDAKHKACMSAAQTFATSKAYRMNFSYVAILAGYQPLPAEEITEDMKDSNTQQQDKTEHWCKEHNVAYFKKGKMKAFAHPIADTGEWCHEHTDKPQDSTQSQPEGKEEVERTAESIKNFGELYSACASDFNLKARQSVWKELGVDSQEKITETPWACYLTIRAAYKK